MGRRASLSRSAFRSPGRRSGPSPPPLNASVGYDAVVPTRPASGYRPSDLDAGALIVPSPYADGKRLPVLARERPTSPPGTEAQAALRHPRAARSRSPTRSVRTLINGAAHQPAPGLILSHGRRQAASVVVTPPRRAARASPSTQWVWLALSVSNHRGVTAPTRRGFLAKSGGSIRRPGTGPRRLRAGVGSTFYITWLRRGRLSGAHAPPSGRCSPGAPTSTAPPRASSRVNAGVQAESRSCAVRP